MNYLQLRDNENAYRKFSWKSEENVVSTSLRLVAERYIYIVVISKPGPIYPHSLPKKERIV